MFQTPPQGSPLRKLLQRAARFSTAARFAKPAAIVALLLAFVPDLSLAQSLPGHFQFGEKRLSADGNLCIHLSDVTIQGEFVLVAPLKRDCTTLTEEFSAAEGYIFPLNGKDEHSRECLVPKGDSPVMTCSDGETSTMRGFTAKEPLRIVGTISHAAQRSGPRLVISLDDFETRYTMAGGSGTKPQKVRLVYYLEFSFSGGQCVLEKIKRSRLVNGRNQAIISVESLGCKIIR